MTNINKRLLCLLVLPLLLLGCSKSAEQPFNTLNDGVITFANDANQWSILVVWAKWCPHCRDKIPQLNQWQQTGQVQVVGYDFDGELPVHLQESVKKLNIQFPVLTKSPFQKLNITPPTVLPTSYLIDPAGRVVRTMVGNDGWAQLTAVVEQQPSR